MTKNGKLWNKERIFSEEEIQDIIHAYLNGESSVKIGQRYNIGHKTILKILHNNNIYVDKQAKRFHRKYALNEKYFENIDTPNKAYILGFLFADGNNSITKGEIRIALQEEDKEILEAMRLEIASEKPLIFRDYSNKHDFGYTYKNQWQLSLYSETLCQDLAKHGMVPNKSLVLEFPNLDENLYPHFIRGYFDGDGSICKTRCGGACLTITSTNIFCLKLKDIIKTQLGIEGVIRDASNHNGITKVYSLTNNATIKQLLDWLYKDAKLFLQRKYDRYQQYYYTNNLLSA